MEWVKFPSEGFPGIQTTFFQNNILKCFFESIFFAVIFFVFQRWKDTNSDLNLVSCTFLAQSSVTCLFYLQSTNAILIGTNIWNGILKSRLIAMLLMFP